MSSSTPSPSAVLEEFDALAPPGTPLTTPEVADGFDCTSRTIYNKLETLVDEGVLETKKVGARGRVWWRPPHNHDDTDRESRSEVDPDELTVDQLLASVPGHYLVVEPDEYEIVAVSDAYLSVTMTDRRTILGRSLFDVFPTEPTDSEAEGVRRLRASLDRVVAEERTDVMAVTHYRIPNPESDNDEFEDRWWSPINSPVFNASGELEFIIHRAEDVTPVVERSQPDDDDDDVLSEREATSSHLTADVIFRGRELERAKEEVYDRLREREEQLETELAATQQLQRLSTRLLQETDVDVLYDEILDAAVTIVDADFASLQLLDTDRNELQLLAHHGFDPEARAFWTWVDAESSSPCGVALATGQRVIVPDVKACEFMAGTKNRDAYLQTGVHAVQTTPLVSRGGDVLGMLSTHWQTPHEPTEHDLRLIDMLARQAADLIEHRQAEEALRESEERYRELFESMTEGFCVIERVDTDPGEPVDFRYVEANPAFAEQSGIGDVVGQTMREVIPGEASEWIEIYDTVLQTGEARRFERELVADGRTLELYAFQVGDGTEERVGVIFQDITERKQRIDALKEAHTQLQAATSAGSVGLWTWNIREDSLTADEYVAESYGLDPETAAAGASVEKFFERVHEDDRDQVRARIEQTVKETGELDTEYRVWNADGELMWLVLRGEVEYDETGEALRMYGAISDVTERKRTTEAIERLNEISRELMEADLQTITARAAEITRTMFDVEYAALWRYNRETGEFRRHDSSTTPQIDPDSIQVADECADRVWQTFIDNEIDVRNHLSVPEGTRSNHPLRSGVLVPLGKHGVICAGSLQADTFDETMVDLAGTTAATLETALNRAAGEQQLAHQNEELARFDRLNSLIREIDQALVQADSLEAIEQAVCERLADSDHYAFAWIGDLDPATETITPRAWAGVDSDYVDTLMTDDTTIDQGPFATAVRTKETQVVEDLAIDTHFAPLREATLERGARSCIGVPLVYEETLYGILSIYGNYPQSDEHDHAVLSELGRTTAYAINAVETRETLQTNRVVELTLECRRPNTPLCRLSQQTGCTIELEGLVHHAESEPAVFFTATGVSADELHAASEETVAITDLLRLTDHEHESLFRARVTESTLASRFVERDAVVRTLTIEEGRATAVVDLSHTASVREFVERIQRTVPEMELRARQTRERPLKTQRTFRTICEERLTAKQEAALQTAYLSGFFESPRVSTGKEVAASLEISQPTFANHLRAAQRGIYEILFEGEQSDAME